MQVFNQIRFFCFMGRVTMVTNLAIKMMENGLNQTWSPYISAVMKTHLFTTVVSVWSGVLIKTYHLGSVLNLILSRSLMKAFFGLLCVWAVCSRIFFLIFIFYLINGTSLTNLKLIDFYSNCVAKTLTPWVCPCDGTTQWLTIKTVVFCPPTINSWDVLAHGQHFTDSYRG